MKKLEKFREPINVFPTELTASEQDVFALILCEISKIVGFNKKSTTIEKKEIPTKFEFTEKELVRLFGWSKNNIRMTLEPAAKKLQATQIGCSVDDGFEYFSPLGYVSYVQGGTFVLEVVSTVANRLAENIVSGFSEIDFRLFVRLSGKYERRLLKLLSQWKGKKEIILSIDKFRELLGIPTSKYKTFANLRRRVIEPAFKDIISKSNGVWSATDKNNLGFELLKNGRYYTDIIFKVSYTPPVKLSNLNAPKPLSEKNRMLVDNYQIVHLYNNETHFPCGKKEIFQLLSNKVQLESLGYELNSKWLEKAAVILASGSSL